MKNHLLYCTSIATFILCLLCLVSCQPKNKELTGLWELDVIQTKDSIGNWVVANWMKGGSGFLHYDNNEHMSVHFWPDTLVDTNAVPYWYVAQFEIKKDTVLHHRIMHAIPSENNKTAKRLFVVKKDTLWLTAPDYGFRLTWLRVKG